MCAVWGEEEGIPRRRSTCKGVQLKENAHHRNFRKNLAWLSCEILMLNFMEKLLWESKKSELYPVENKKTLKKLYA